MSHIWTLTAPWQRIPTQCPPHFGGFCSLVWIQEVPFAFPSAAPLFRSARGQLLLPCPWVLLSGEQITLLPTGSLAVASVEQSRLSPKLQGCSQHRFLTHLQGKDLDAGRDCCPSHARTIPSKRGDAGEPGSRSCSDFPSNSRKTNIFEDGRQIHTKF